MAGQAIADLSDAQRFKRIAVFRHRNPAPFLDEYFRSYLGHPSAPVAAFLILNVLVLTLIGLEWSAGRYNSKGLAAFGFGALLVLALTPFHEALHGLAYKAAGAKDVRYFVVWRKAAAFAAAHRFVTGGKAMFWVGIMPTLVINPALLLYAYLAPPEWRLTILSALFLHIVFSYGDIAVLNFFYVHRDENPLTYDDVDEGFSYFFVRNKAPAAPLVEQAER